MLASRPVGWFIVCGDPSYVWPNLSSRVSTEFVMSLTDESVKIFVLIDEPSLIKAIIIISCAT